MLFQNIQRSDPDNVFAVVRNVAGATITKGYPVVFDISTSGDGNRVAKPATASLSCLVGIAAETVVDSGYFQVQKYGYAAAAYITNTTNVIVAAGDILIPVTAQWYLTRGGAGDGSTGMIMNATAIATATAGAVAAANSGVYIKCM